MKNDIKKDNSGKSVASSSFIINCNSKCQLCKFNFNPSPIYYSFVTGKEFRFNPNLSGMSHTFTCNSSNIIYLISCKKCQFQYVGMTTQSLKNRFYNHKSYINNPKSNTLLSTHFNSFNHSFEDVSVQIIDYLEKDSNSYVNRKRLLALEEYHMKRLVTLHPFGLNDYISSLKQSITHVDLSLFHSRNSPYFSVPTFRKKRSHGHKRNCNIKSNTKDINQTLQTISDLFEKGYIREVIKTLYTLPHKSILYARQNLLQCRNSFSKEFVSVIVAFSSKFIKPPPNKKDNIYFICNFTHKVLDSIGVNSIIKNKNILNKLPMTALKYFPSICYKYNKPIGKTLFNYNKILGELNKDDVISDGDCDCLSNTEYIDYVYGPHQHVVTGNLDIVKVSELKDIMKKGAKFREIPKFNKKSIVHTFKKDLDEFIKKWSKSSGVDVELFDIWASDVLSCFERGLDKHKHIYSSTYEVLKDKRVLHYLHEFHNRFVLVPIDKASNNFAIICKQFYINILKKELGIHNNSVSGNEVYQLSEFDPSYVITSHKQSLRYFNIRLTSQNHHIPYIYCTVKMHKNPYKFRFISGASRSSLKQLSKELSLVLKSIKESFKNYCNCIANRSGFNIYWSIDNSFQCLQKLFQTSPESVHSYDFSTLYTKLPLQKIYSDLEKLVIKMFSNKVHSENYVAVNVYNNVSFFTSDAYKPSYKMYTVDKTLDALRFVLFNTNVQFAGMVFKQTLGIPMGDNSAPFIADLFLSWCEYSYMCRLIKQNDVILASKFAPISRYLDDIITVNFDDFGKVAEDIYPTELLLEKNDGDGKSDTFLDLDIHVSTGQYNINIYNKTDYFNFHVISFPFLDSNIANNVCYNSFSSQLYRFCKLVSGASHFVAKSSNLYVKLVERGYDRNLLLRKFSHFLKYHYQLVNDKFGDFNILGEFSSVIGHAHSSNIHTKDKSNSISHNTSNINSSNLSYHDVLQSSTVALDNSVSSGSGFNSHISKISHLNFGFNNSGNNCYLITAVHVIFCLQSYIPLLDCTLNNKTSLHNLLLDILNTSQISNRNKKFAHFKNTLALNNPLFNNNLQQDFDEAFQYICSILCEEILDPRNKLLFKKVFFGSFKQVYTCCSCTYRSSNVEDFVQIILQAEKDIDTSLVNYFKDNYITKMCQTCGINSNHKHIVKMFIKPRVISLMVNRMNSFGIKTVVNIHHNTTIQISGTSYNLCAMVLHHGVDNYSGHYNVYVKICSGWWLCNDHAVSSVSLDNIILNSASYVLFYVEI